MPYYHNILPPISVAIYKNSGVLITPFDYTTCNRFETDLTGIETRAACDDKLIYYYTLQYPTLQDTTSNGFGINGGFITYVHNFTIQ